MSLGNDRLLDKDFQKNLSRGTGRPQVTRLLRGMPAWMWSALTFKSKIILTVVQVSPEEIINREELGCGSWTSFASGCSSIAVQQTLSLWLPSTAVETAIALCTSCCAMARRHRLNTSIVLVAVHGLSNLFWGGICGRAFTLSNSSPPPSHP